MAQKQCWHCGCYFSPSRSDQQYCSKKCYNHWYYLPVPKCKECGRQDCTARNNNLKYSPKQCPERRENWKKHKD